MTEREHNDDSTRNYTKSTVVSLDTRELDTTEGRNRWADTLDTLYCEMDVAWPERTPFDGEWGGHPFGGLHVSSIHAGLHTVVRSPAMIRSDSVDGFLVCVVTEGSVAVTQHGRTTRLDQGALALLDLSVPFDFDAPTDFRQAVVRIPRELLTSRLPERVVEHLTARTIPGTSGAGKLVGRFLVELSTLDQEVPDGPATALSTSTLDMLVTALSGAADTTRSVDLHHSRDLARVQQIVEERLHDPELTLSDVAAEANISVRQIQKLFSDAGTTPRAWLYRTRLERARRYLLTTAFTVAEVSIASGFRDVSHFSRTFRAAYGTSPGRYRSLSMSES
ncbi:AraC family transcriptional regulator [Rhodococcus sp. HNM0563]|uniref:AraC family transcriptional regulator n=1 Tax=Rhodococcus sp. HNM0563 TaxID=2716339 RepID=UPI00146C7299|nr:AraC family transcriptional regulator [Rhodococcus sp. HNM0563]NLU64005.1 AraC family transcriptional regulator [Rhodococcus sp. HNM0563]